MLRNPFFLFLLTLSTLPGFLSAQQPDSMMAVYADRFPQEKVYVQFDKNVYNPGESIWMKAYLFTGFDPSPYSKSFYAELWDGNGKLLQRKTAPLTESTAATAFEIPTDFKGSRVHVRAYTTWMLNFDTAFIFEKDLRVVNASSDSVGSIPKKEYMLAFFPEGGDLIGGLENNIAFKANDENGLPIHVSGTIRDAAGKSIADFNSTHNGMGRFILLPEKTDVLHAEWKDEKGEIHRTDLPTVKQSGIVLKALNDKQGVLFLVGRTSDDTRMQHLKIIAHMNQQLVYKALINLTDNFSSSGHIPVAQLPTGILTLTVFDELDNPVAERVIFNNTHHYFFNSSIKVNAKSTVKRGRNVIEISVPDSIHCNLSMAVTDGEVDGKKKEDDNIISHLLLTSDLKGYIKDPYYYFMNASDSLVAQLDLVMLTHGWRRFKWDLVTHKKTPVIKYPIQNYLTLGAEVFGVDASRIAKDESMIVFLNRKDRPAEMITVPHTAGGKFEISGFRFTDTAKAYYQFSINKNLSNEAAVVFNTGLFNGYRAIKPYAMRGPAWSAADSSLIRKNRYVTALVEKNREEYKNIKTLATVTVTARVKSEKDKLDEQYTSALFRGGDGYSFDLLTDVSGNAYPDILTYLQGKVAGLQISNNGQSTSLQWRGGQPVLYLNESPVDVDQIKNITVSDIALVKVFRPGAGIALGDAGGGTIAVYTKKGGDVKADPNVKGLEAARLIGYAPVRQFYVPNYLQDPQRDSADNRTTLYWNPYIITNKGQSTLTFTFFNSDVTHQLRVVLEGFDADGKLTKIEQTIE